MDFLISDLHLTDNPLEEYRWVVFSWLEEIRKQYDIESLYILGDLTEKKDNHSSKLVNRLVEEFKHLSMMFPRVVVLRGNHDGIDPSWPFFLFLKDVNGDYGIEYYHQPEIVGNELFIPHSKNFKDDLTKMSEKYLSHKVRRIFLHQTFKGAKAANDFILDGVDPSLLEAFTGSIFSGDIHNPQSVGPVVYVGSPYPVYFGDDFVGGGILRKNNGSTQRIKFETIKRSVVEIDYTQEGLDPYSLDVSRGDQFKVKLIVNRSDSGAFSNWKKDVKEAITKREGVLVSIELKIKEEKTSTAKRRKLLKHSHEGILSRFCKSEGLDEYYQRKGKEFL